MLLRNALLATLDPPDSPRVASGDLRIEGGTITERAPGLAARPDEETIELTGAPVLPGLVNAHTHLYSALARGMPGPKEPPRGFLEILERVWWRLDRALDEEAVALSGLAGAIDAALSGVTLVVDHHASPSAIPGSLDALRRAVEEVGLRSVLCYEVTDRNGPEGRDLGLEESRRFLAGGPTPLTRGMVGGHASFTLSEETMERLGALVDETGAPFHIHVAEDTADVEDCWERYDTGLVQRLGGHGLLRPSTILAHGVHLEASELDVAQSRGCWLAHNPRSNMNNDVGYASTDAFRQAALGTDGMDGDILAEARVCFLRMREAGRDDAMEATLHLLTGGHRLAAALFERPFGTLDAGAPADLVVLDYPSPTPLHDGNLAGHLLFGIDRSHVRSVMVEGRWVVLDRSVVTVDAEAVFARAREAAPRLWRRMTELAPTRGPAG
ncbi:MAG: amidohydrolase family protein [Acidobacteria bacterium]|jgi:putative selenium metabolism protein SsnA|nr:amidohydrolase family protein [Acidobacteriota bacterium]